MKVLVEEFVTESDANIPTICTIKQYNIGFGENCIQKMGIREVLERNDVTPIPNIYANARAVGVVEKNVFTYIEHMLIDTLKKNLHEIDGISLMLHDADEMEELGSGNHHTLRGPRELAGPCLPIAIICDPHGNLCGEYTEPTIILQSHRESPHTDADETMEEVAEMLCKLLKKRRDIHAVYHEFPLILDGEQSVSADEPVLSINRYVDELEKDDRVLSCSWRVGYTRRDYDVAGCDIIVVPYNEQGLSYTQEAADRLAAYVWEKHHKFRYTGLTASPSKTLQMTLDLQDEPVFITDFGDNVTSSATGRNTDILRQMLQTETTKKFLFATMYDPAAYQILSACKTGEELSFAPSVDFDGLSSAVELGAAVKSGGNLTGFMMHNHTSVFGHCISVHIKGTLTDITVADTGWAVCELHQLVSAGINVDTYDVIVIKQGHIFPDFEAKGKPCVVSLTRGATLQDIARLLFKYIIRPMFPIDDI